MRGVSAVVSAVAVAVIVIVMIVGALRSLPSGRSDVPDPVPTVPDHSDGHVEESLAPAPENQPPTGAAHEERDLPPHEVEQIVQRATDFWRAFSVRNPEERDEALSHVAVPYLAQQMRVASTARIPIVEPDLSVLVSGSFTEATVVSRAGAAWWYVTLIFDPVPETWSAQTYERATPGLIMAANRITREGR